MCSSAIDQPIQRDVALATVFAILLFCLQSLAQTTKGPLSHTRHVVVTTHQSLNSLIATFNFTGRVNGSESPPHCADSRFYVETRYAAGGQTAYVELRTNTSVSIAVGNEIDVLGSIPTIASVHPDNFVCFLQSRHLPSIPVTAFTASVAQLLFSGVSVDVNVSSPATGLRAVNVSHNALTLGDPDVTISSSALTLLWNASVVSAAARLSLPSSVRLRLHVADNARGRQEQRVMAGKYGSAGLLANFTAMDDGQTSDAISIAIRDPTCSVLDLARPNHTLIRLTTMTMNDGAVRLLKASFSCQPGFYILGVPDLLCVADGQFDPALPPVCMAKPPQRTTRTTGTISPTTTVRPGSESPLTTHPATVQCRIPPLSCPHARYLSSNASLKQYVPIGCASTHKLNSTYGAAWCLRGDLPQVLCPACIARESNSTHAHSGHDRQAVRLGGAITLVLLCIAFAFFLPGHMKRMRVQEAS